MPCWEFGRARSSDCLNKAPRSPMTPSNAQRIEGLLQEVSAILLSENQVRGGGWSFSGWSEDGRAVTHTVRISGYERTGPKVEAERAVRVHSQQQSSEPCNE